ncbi:MAG: glycosyltransferase family protein [Methylocystaceae bacterium]|nr:glycosyltransferase family protein [Methylocystaceae bacterium]
MTDTNTGAPKNFNDLSPQEKGELLFLKATQLHKENKFEDALKFYGNAVAYWPEQPDAYNNMAVALRKLGKFEAALVCYNRSLGFRPDHGGTYSNMGNVLNDLDRIQDAIKAHDKAIELEPDNLLYLYNKALVLRDAGKCKQALTLFDKILKIDPNYKDCRWDRALTYLVNGDFKNGFAEYDARWSLAKSPPRTFKQPRWEGDALSQRRLFIHREQGFGDAIQFVRLIPSIKKRYGGHIILECQPELMRLFSNVDGIDQLIPFGSSLPEFDTWIPMMSLGHVLKVDENNIPGEVPYLAPPPNNRFHVRPAPEDGLNIAFAWAGSKTHQNDRRRSVEIERFLPLLNHKNVTLFSLQKGDRQNDILTSGAKSIVVDASADIKDFADSAGLLSQMDLVITIDTSLAHLAGALGKPVWLMLPYTPDWRWMLKRDDSPWYPSMHIFRQSKPGDWDGAFKKLYDALDAQLAL